MWLTSKSSSPSLTTAQLEPQPGLSALRLPFKRRSPSITVGAQDLWAFAHCCPSRSPRNSMCPCTTLECALLEIWLRSPHNRTTVPHHDDPQIVEQCYLLQYLGAVERDESEYITWIYAQQRNVATLWRVLGEVHLHIQKLTLSTTLAQAEEKVEQKLPLQYSKYVKVFSEPKDGKLPPQRPFNHTIDLKEIFVPKVAKSYLMNPKEMEACKEFINEHLKSGKIRKSQSPQASPFFFIQTKDAGLCSCQDYRYLNEHSVKNTYPFPLISTLIDKLKGAKWFSTMDIQWGYNNIRIKEGDEWKATFTG